MEAPDFIKKIVEVLAKRVRFQCSNCDCGVQTVGPNSDPEKATTIGEAAHIMGAKLGSARYDDVGCDARSDHKLHLALLELPEPD